MKRSIQLLGLFAAAVCAGAACAQPESTDTSRPRGSDDLPSVGAPSLLDPQLLVVEEAVSELRDRRAEPRPSADDPGGASLVDLPPEAVAAILGTGAGTEVRVEKISSGGPLLTTKRVYAIEPRAQISDEERASIARERAALGFDRTVDKESPAPPSLGDPITDEAGRELHYVRFFPQIPPDAPSRVDWTAPENRAHRRRALLAAEAGRQRELDALATDNQRHVEKHTSCVWAHRTRSANAAYVWCAPGGAPAASSAIEEVRPVHRGTLNLKGDGARAATGMQHGHVIDQGFDGEVGRTGSGRPSVEVAIIDPEGFNKAQLHPAYMDNVPGSASRITRRRTCTQNGCANTATVATGPQEDVHGQRILGAFADLRQGQDPNLTTVEREQRTYGAPEAELELYFVPEWHVAMAIEDAASTDYGVDVIEISASGGACANPSVSADIRDAWDLAYSMGTIGVLSAGNTIHRLDDGCSLNGWVTRPDILAIGAMGDNLDPGDTTNGWVDPTFPATPVSGWVYDTESLMGWHWADTSLANNCPNTNPNDTGCWSSAMGGAALHVSPGLLVSGAWRGVDLVAPTARELSARFINGVATYGESGSGTSIAAPDAASVVAGLLDWAYSSGFTLFETPQITHVNMLMMGDGARGGHRPGAGPTTSYSGRDPLWGAGRLKARIFTDAGLDGPGAWGTGSLDLTNGQVIDFPIGGGPMSSDVDLWRGTIAWDEPNFGPTAQSADIIFRVVTTAPVNGQCVNPGGVGGTVVRSDMSFDLEKAIVLQGGGMTALHNKCGWIRIAGLSIPNNASGQPVRRVYRADYWEDRDREAYEQLTNIE